MSQKKNLYIITDTMNINKLPTGFRFEFPANGGVWGCLGNPSFGHAHWGVLRSYSTKCTSLLRNPLCARMCSKPSVTYSHRSGSVLARMPVIHNPPPSRFPGTIIIIVTIVTVDKGYKNMQKGFQGTCWK